MATDIPDYVRQTLEEVPRRGVRLAGRTRPSDWRVPWDDWISTRYEQKALREGRVPHYLTFRRQGREIRAICHDIRTEAAPCPILPRTEIINCHIHTFTTRTRRATFRTRWW